MEKKLTYNEYALRVLANHVRVKDMMNGPGLDDISPSAALIIVIQQQMISDLTSMIDAYDNAAKNALLALNDNS